jgi:hypothetical protein
MASKLSAERLIALASGDAEPTPNELVILNEDYSTRQELEEYRLLFSDLHELPAKEPNDIDLSSVLPNVRDAINKRSWLERLLDYLPAISRPSWSAVGAAAAIFLFVFMPAMINGPDFNQDSSIPMYSGALETIPDSFYLETAIMGENTDSSLLAESFSADGDGLAEFEEVLTDTGIYAQIADLDTAELSSLTDELRQALMVGEGVE